MKLSSFIILILFATTINSMSDWNQVFKMNGTMMQWDLDCADSLNCISLGNKGLGMVNARTTDGGYNWFIQFADTQKVIYNDQGQVIDVIPTKFKGSRCLDFVTPDFVVVGHIEGQITISRDGGVNWDSVQLSTSRDLQTIKFIDNDYGVAFGGHKTLFKTYNGGNNWEEFKINYYGSEIENYGTSEINIDLVGKDSLIVVIYNYRDTSDKYYTIYRTFDGGQNWKMGTKIPRYSDYKPFFLNMYEGWLVGRIGAGNKLFYDVIYYTSDGGQNWESQLDTFIVPQLGLKGIYFANNKVGIAWGEGGKIWKTNDGGVNWTQEIMNDSIPFFNKVVIPNKHLNKRIANTNLAGSIWLYEDLTSVNDNEINIGDIKIYPNPSSDFITISLPAFSPTLKRGVDGTTVKVQIFDVLGIEVAQTFLSVANLGARVSVSQTGMSELLNIDVSHLPTGVYFVRINCSNGACSIVEKFVKM